MALLFVLVREKDNLRTKLMVGSIMYNLNADHPNHPYGEWRVLSLRPNDNCVVSQYTSDYQSHCDTLRVETL